MKEHYRGTPERPRIAAEFIERGRGFERYKLARGVYNAQFGFRNIGAHEEDWFSKSSDNEADWEKPFIFDYNHPAVRTFESRLFKGTGKNTGPEATEELVRRFGERIRSLDLSDPEFNNSLSDVVTNGSGACDAKSVLFGSLLVRNTAMQAQVITGQYGRVREKVSYPWSHQWMRMAGGKNLYLFDPMYEKFAAFERDGENVYALDSGDDYFINLTPGCYPAATLLNSFGIQKYAGLNIVKSYEGDSQAVYVSDDQILSSQLLNQTTFAFEMKKEGILTLHDGAVKTTHGGSASYFPVRSLVKTE